MVRERALQIDLWRKCILSEDSSECKISQVGSCLVDPKEPQVSQCSWRGLSCRRVAGKDSEGERAPRGPRGTLALTVSRDEMRSHWSRVV